MCDPASISISLAVAGAVQQGVQGFQAAHLAQRSFEKNEKAATIAASLQYRGVSERTLEEREQLVREVAKVTEESKRAVGTAKLAATEGGVGGQSVGALLDSYRVQAAAAIEDLTSSQRNRDRQAESERLGIREQLRGRVLGGFQGVQSPGFLGSALRIASAASQAYNENSYYDPTTQTRRIE